MKRCDHNKGCHQLLQKVQVLMSRRIIVDYCQQLLEFYGIHLSSYSGNGLATALGCGVLVDLLVFVILNHMGLSVTLAHITSFLSACVLTSPIHSRWMYSSGKTPSLRINGGIVVISLLALFLRGGILGSLIKIGCPFAVAISITSLASLSAFTLGLLFFLFPNDRVKSDTRGLIFSLGVIILGAALRFFYLGLPALLPEEAYYWNYSRHLAIGYLDHPPMVALLIRFGTSLFGTSEFGVRIGSFLCWLVTAGFSYALTYSLYDRLTALRAVMLLSVLPFFFAIGVMMTPDVPLTACWSAVIYFLYLAVLLDSPHAWLGVGIFLGLGLFSKYTIALLGPPIILFMLIDPKSRRWFFNPWPYLAVMIALMIFSPVIIWNAQHHWASFLFQSEARLKSTSDFSTPALFGQILLLLTPIGALGAASFFVYGYRLMDNRRYLFFLLLTVMPLAVFLFFSLSKQVKLNWTGPLWLALIPFFASMMINTTSPILVTWCRRMLPATIVGLLLLSGTLLHYYSLGLPGIPLLRHPFLTGWDKFAASIDKIVAIETKKYGKRPMVVGMDKYQTASGLAFYRYKNALSQGLGSHEIAIHETLGSHIFGRNGLMYAYWFPSKTIIGEDLLIVSSYPDSVKRGFLKKYATELERVKEVDISKSGRTIDQYYIRLLRGYHPVN